MGGKYGGKGGGYGGGGGGGGGGYGGGGGATYGFLSATEFFGYALRLWFLTFHVPELYFYLATS